MLDVVGRIGAGVEAVQHIDLRLRRQQAAGRNTLAEVGDEEGARAGGPQRRRRPIEADPIGVRLDHRGASAGRRQAGERAPVVGERGEIDGQTAGRAVGRGDGLGYLGSHLSRFSITATVGASKPGMRLEAEALKAHARKQPLVFRQRQPHSQPHARKAARPGRRFAGGDQATT